MKGYDPEKVSPQSLSSSSSSSSSSFVRVFLRVSLYTGRTHRNNSLNVPFLAQVPALSTCVPHGSPTLEISLNVNKSC